MSTVGVAPWNLLHCALNKVYSIDIGVVRTETAVQVVPEVRCRILQRSDVRYLFTAIWFPLGGGGRRTCTKIGKRQLHTNEKQYTKQYKTTEYTK
jgi:hypothetical protein